MYRCTWAHCHHQEKDIPGMALWSQLLDALAKASQDQPAHKHLREPNQDQWATQPWPDPSKPQMTLDIWKSPAKISRATRPQSADPQPNPQMHVLNKCPYVYITQVWVVCYPKMIN